MSDNRGDQLVADYLDRVRAAAASLDPARREELIQDLREHIAAARGELSPETEAGVRTVLERLGDPAAIAAEASADEAPAVPPVAPPPAPRSNRTLVAVLITVLALVVLAPVAICVIGGLGFFVFQQESPTEHGPVATYIPAPSPRPS